MTFPAEIINLAHALAEARSRCEGGQCLAGELKQALVALQPLLEEGQLDFIEVSGGKPSVLIRSCSDAWHPPENLTEAYSLRMMAANLRNLGVTYLSLALGEEVRTARQTLLRNLQELHGLLTDMQSLPPAVTVASPPPPAPESTSGTAALIARKQALEKQKDAALEHILRDPEAALMLQQDEGSFWQLFEPLGRAFDAGELDAAQLEATALTHIRKARKAQALVEAQIQQDRYSRQWQAAQANSQRIVALVLEQKAQRADFTEMDAADCVLEALNQSQIPDFGAVPLSGIRVMNAAALRLGLSHASLQQRPLALLEQQLSAQQAETTTHQPAWLFCQTALWALDQLKTYTFACNPPLPAGRSSNPAAQAATPEPIPR